MRVFATITFGVALFALAAGCRREGQTTQTGGGLAAVVTEETLEAAFNAAKEDGKPVMAVFTAPSWCHWCRELDEKTLSNAQVQQRLKAFHVVFVDFDKEKELASQYQVTAVPHTIIFDSSGKRVRDILGFREPAPFLEEVETAIAGVP